jgi:hypothetical protein
MNRKTITMILAVVILAAFFLPYMSFFGQSISAFQIVKGGGKADVYIMVLAPVAAILLLVGALNNEKYTPSRSVLGILALVGWIYPIIRMFIDGGSMAGQVFKILGIGFWLGLVAALAVILYNPKS